MLRKIIAVLRKGVFIMTKLAGVPAFDAVNSEFFWVFLYFGQSEPDMICQIRGHETESWGHGAKSWHCDDEFGGDDIKRYDDDAN